MSVCKSTSYPRNSVQNAARNGTSPALGAFPAAPVFAVAPAMVAPGIFGRATALVARIKTAPG
jgi:hypothetical protein